MAGTITIPLTTLTVGQHTYGPASFADTDVLVVLTIDRTPANGFNSQPGTTTAAISIEQSNDSGTTWGQVAATTFTGGVLIRRGVEVDSNDVGVFPWAGTNRLLRAQVVIGGASVAVQGTLVIS